MFNNIIFIYAFPNRRKMKNVDQKKNMKNEKHKMINFFFFLVERNINDMIKEFFK